LTEKRRSAVKHKCPICKAETDSAVHADFPFCSNRCRDRDLGNWAAEKYVVSEPVFDEEEVTDGDRNNVVLKPDNDLDKQNDIEH
jgi:endogenous inhibitor of DNA gyrase (YacG/DUF329 family)